MNSAVDAQFGLVITALTTLVTQACPAPMFDGGCSLTSSDGITHDTAGRFPALAASKKRSADWMLPNWLFCLIVVKKGSGFQMPGVLACCLTGRHLTASSSRQSGSVPVTT